MFCYLFLSHLVRRFLLQAFLIKTNGRKNDRLEKDMPVNFMETGGNDSDFPGSAFFPISLNFIFDFCMDFKRKRVLDCNSCSSYF